MIFLSIQNTTIDTKYSQSQLSQLREMVLAQLDDLTLLCTIIGYLKGFQQVGVDRKGAKSYTDKIQLLSDRQNKRFQEIDACINANSKDIKKGKTEDQSVIKYGREIRKLEAGLRTLKLFTSDVVEMLRMESTKINRAEERIRYFEGRSATLEAEMQLMINKF